MVSWDHSCPKNYALSSQRESYKIIFPEKDTNSAECTPDDKFGVRIRGCLLRFNADPFILNLYEICIDSSKQTVRDCRKASIEHKVGGQVTQQFCSRERSSNRCLGSENSIRVIFHGVCPYNFEGQTLIYLRPRNSNFYVLFKEKRQCAKETKVVEADHGTIISQFKHRSHGEPLLCPVLLKAKHDWRIFKEVCFWLEVDEFLESDFHITVSSVDERKHLKFGYKTSNTHELFRKYCDKIRPNGYLVSAKLINRHKNLNNHKAVLKYSYELREKDEESDGDEEDERRFNAIFMPVIVLAIIGVVACLFICCICRTIMKKRMAREHNAAAGPPVNSPRQSPSTYGEVSETPVSRPEPSAPSMNEPRATVEPPPSYESLFVASTR